MIHMVDYVNSTVHLSRTIGGDFINISGYMQGPKLKFVENFGVTGSLTLVNDLKTSANNLLSSECTLWSSGSGAIRPGMFLYIYRNEGIPGNLIGIFMITEMSVADDLIKLTFGDAIQILRATGADYHRNHYSSAQQHNLENAYGGWDPVAEKLYVTKPAGVTLSATGGDVQWAVNSNINVSQFYSFNMGFASDGTAKFTFALDLDWLFSFSFYRQNMLRCRVRLLVEGAVVASKTYSESSYSSMDTLRSITLDAPTYVRGKSIDVIIDNISTTYGADMDMASYPGSIFEYYRHFVTGSTYDSGTLNDVIFKSIYVGSYYEYANAGQADADNATKYYVTGINNVTTISSSMGSPEYIGRARITYLDLAGGLSMSTIFQSICYAAGYGASTISSSRTVGVFRCAGANFFSYLLALADMSEPSGTYAGRQHAISCSPVTWGAINLGYRLKASDTAAVVLYYAGDESPVSGAIPMMRFSPSMTMMYRPFLAITKGTKDDGTPIIIAMRDPEVTVGSAVSVVDGSVTTVEDAALYSYSEIVTNRSKDWEGTIVLSGIYTDLMISTGIFVGGRPIRIYDSRFGMSDYQARIKEVQIDVSTQQTTLVLNNYSEMYANSLIDSTKMAYTAGNIAVEASSNDVFAKQYVSVVSAATLSGSSSHTIEIYSVEKGYVSAVADVLKVVDLGICVLSAYFGRGVSTVTGQYAISKIRVDGSTVIDIDQHRRPDKYSNQSLIVNVQMVL